MTDKEKLKKASEAFLRSARECRIALGTSDKESFANLWANMFGGYPDQNFFDEFFSPKKKSK